MSLFNNVQSSQSQSQGGSLFGQSNQQNRGTGLFGTTSANTNKTTPPLFNNSASGFGGGIQGTTITVTGQGIFVQANQANPPSHFGNNTGTTTGGTQSGSFFNTISSSNVNSGSSSSLFQGLNNMSNKPGLLANSGSPSTQTAGTSTGGSLFATQNSSSSPFRSTQPVSESAAQKSPFVNTTETISSPQKLGFSLTAEQVKALFPQMLTNQSSVISKFMISNDFGKIEFEENRDVREKDLDALSELKQKVDSLLTSDLSAEAVQLHKGEKLDKPATVTLYNCSGENKKYEEIAKKMGCQFIDYDAANKILKIKILYL